jgi:hypothetical protein
MSLAVSNKNSLLDMLSELALRANPPQNAFTLWASLIPELRRKR